MDGPSTYPDGQTPAVVDRLVEQTYDAITSAPRPTSALLDGSAAERRRRRKERRAVAALMRAMPVRPGGAGGLDGWAA